MPFLERLWNAGLLVLFLQLSHFSHKVFSLKKKSAWKFFLRENSKAVFRHRLKIICSSSESPWLTTFHNLKDGQVYLHSAIRYEHLVSLVRLNWLHARQWLSFRKHLKVFEDNFCVSFQETLLTDYSWWFVSKLWPWLSSFQGLNSSRKFNS